MSTPKFSQTAVRTARRCHPHSSTITWANIFALVTRSSTTANSSAPCIRLSVPGMDAPKATTIEIIDEEFNPARRELVNIPVIGTVAAGQPILAEENISDYFPVPADILPNADVFMLEVKGESMINAGILNGDKVIVRMQNTAENGEMVVALLDDSATVKTFYKEDGHYRLQPENDTMEPIITDKVQILGRVIGIFRLMK